MESRSAKSIVFILLVFTFLLPLSQVTGAQELGGGAKLVGSSPFLFAEAKFWLLAVEIGVGLSGTDSAPVGYEESSIDYSLAGKVYPFQFANFSPYLGMSSIFSSSGYLSQSRTFAGVEFDLSERGVPLSVFGGGGLVSFIGSGDSGLGWHLGVKYKFSF